MGVIRIELGKDSYDIVIRRGALYDAGSEFDLDRKVLVVSDDGVPDEYGDVVMDAAREGFRMVFRAGEANKSIDTLNEILTHMVRCGFDRHDCVVAVGGGISGDMAGFAASCYMRGIDFYNIPTTVLSQVDSSVGGKTAINLGGVKNSVGAFHQPKKVLIDPDVVSTLPPRQVANGLAEALKMAFTFDADLFSLFLEGDVPGNLDAVIEKSILLKKIIVQQDEHEKGLRKVLNFGHTIGHGIEASLPAGTLFHGECVSLGMIPMCSESVRPALEKALERLGLPTRFSFDEDAVCEAISHDKKSTGDRISTVFVPEIGKYEFRDMGLNDIRALLPLIQK